MPVGVRVVAVTEHGDVYQVRWRHAFSDLGIDAGKDAAAQARDLRGLRFLGPPFRRGPWVERRGTAVGMSNAISACSFIEVVGRRIDKASGLRGGIAERNSFG